MKRIKKADPKKIIILSSVLCGLGIFLFTTLQTTSIDNELGSHSETTNIVKDQPAQQISTSELIAASARRVLTETQNEPVSYPNITPKRLENPFSPTLEGTDIDGQLKVGEDGQLVVDIAVKDFFDYFLSATAEVSPERALDEMLRVASESLPPENFLQVQSMLDNYLAYKEAAISLMARPMLPHDQQTIEYQLQMMEEGIKELRELRRQHMPENQVEAFFGLEEAYEDFTIASIRIQNDPNLSPEQMQLALQAQRDQLPELIRQTENQLHEDMQTTQEINQILLSDLRDSEVANTLKEKGLSDNAIQEALDFRKQQQIFDQQYVLYQQERKQLISAGLSKEDIERQTHYLLEKYFDTEEAKTQAKVRDLQS